MITLELDTKKGIHRRLLCRALKSKVLRPTDISKDDLKLLLQTGGEFFLDHLPISKHLLETCIEYNKNSSKKKKAVVLSTDVFEKVVSTFEQNPEFLKEILSNIKAFNWVRAKNFPKNAKLMGPIVIRDFLKSSLEEIRNENFDYTFSAFTHHKVDISQFIENKDEFEIKLIDYIQYCKTLKNSGGSAFYFNMFRGTRTDILKTCFPDIYAKAELLFV